MSDQVFMCAWCGYLDLPVRHVNGCPALDEMFGLIPPRPRIVLQIVRTELS